MKLPEGTYELLRVRAEAEFAGSGSVEPPTLLVALRAGEPVTVQVGQLPPRALPTGKSNWKHDLEVVVHHNDRVKLPMVVT